MLWGFRNTVWDILILKCLLGVQVEMLSGQLGKDWAKDTDFGVIKLQMVLKAF